MSLIWHNFILFIQLFKRLLNLKCDMEYKYNAILDRGKLILIKSVTGLHEMGDCDKCIMNQLECRYSNHWLCELLGFRVKYIHNVKEFNGISLFVSSYVKMYKYDIIRVS